MECADVTVDYSSECKYMNTTLTRTRTRAPRRRRPGTALYCCVADGRGDHELDAATWDGLSRRPLDALATCGRSRSATLRPDDVSAAAGRRALFYCTVKSVVVEFVGRR
ncbi:hypothetical protein EVAR_44392_1 [Eumeta japonica]|uniref:Uncharacterized protein n=1 Tax=Eumeta variegata TaxID=151549 RepID=A0A4C1XU76_EUMVA|nr:hypothetical protein EVAR_44392_1 [Eumeta japonica]